jgi:competence protein ComEC
MAGKTDTTGMLRWPAFLFRQYLLLIWCAGIFSARFFPPGLTAASLLFLLCFAFNAGTPAGRRFTKEAFFSCLAFCLPAFILGFGYARFREYAPGPVPDWVLEAVTPDEGSGLYKKGLDVKAVVLEANGKSDRRLELILGGVRPAGRELPELPGRLVLTRHDQALYDPSVHSQVYAPAEINPERRPAPGQEIELALKIRKVHGLKNPGLWDIESYWNDREVSYRAVIAGAGPEAGPGFILGPVPDNLAAVRESLRQRVVAALPANSSGLMPGAAFIPAWLFGDNYLMNSQDTNLLAAATLSHSLALSGLHLGYAAGLGYLLARVIFYCFPGLGLYLPRRRLAACCALPPALLYIWIGGGPPSLLRAGLMLFFCGLLLFLMKPAVIQDALLLAVFLILLAHPQAIFDIRLQLSALALAAIALLAPLLSFLHARLDALLPGQRQGGGQPGARRGRAAVYALKGAVAMLCTSFAVQLTLMPVLTNAFTSVGALFPLNLIWLPVLGVLVMPSAFLGLLAAALNFTAFARLCFQIAAYPCAWLMDFLRCLQEAEFLPVLLPGRPHWLFIAGFWLILGMLPVLYMRFARREPSGLPAACIGLGLALCLLPAGLRIHAQNQDIVRLRLLDVGQGQAILLECPGGKRLLLDGGGLAGPRFDLGKEVIAAALTDNHPARLDYMLASHPDFDHIQGLIYPLTHLRVDYFADNGALPSSKGRNAVTYSRLLDVLRKKELARNSLAAGQSIDLGPELRLEILHPPAAQSGTYKDNDLSLVARLVWRGKSLALLCADAEKAAQRELLQRYDRRVLQAQIMVLPHHGSAGASLKAFYEAVNPEIALAGCGYGNRWFFPAAQTRQNLADCGIKLLTTAEYGQIIIEWEGQEAKMSVNSARDPKIYPIKN